MSISSTHINSTSGLRRTSTPTAPIAEQHRAEDEVPRRRRCGCGPRRSRLIDVARLRRSRRGQEDRADDGDDEQNRRELEGEHVGAEQVLRPSPGCWRRGIGFACRRSAATRSPGSGPTSRVVTMAVIISATIAAPTMAASGRWILIGSIRRSSTRVDAEQHDHEQEQHDDRPGVDDHLHGGEEVRLLGDEVHGDAEQREHEAERGVHRMAAHARRRGRRRSPSPSENEDHELHQSAFPGHAGRVWPLAR